MNWEIIGATGEWAGAIVVGFTLIYLAVQIRQQNQIARYAAWESIIDGANQQLINSTPESMAAYLKGRNQPSECNETEMMLFQNGMRIYLHNTHKAFRAYSNGFLPKEDWLVIAKVFAAEIRTPGGQIWRKGNEDIARGMFTEVDALQEEITAVLDLKSDD